VQEMHYFPSFISIENGSLYYGYSIQEIVTLIYSINNLETLLFVNKHPDVMVNRNEKASIYTFGLPSHVYAIFTNNYINLTYIN